MCVAVTVVKGPHNGRAEAVGLGYNRGIRHDDPLSIDSHTIVPVLRIPVDVLHSDAVCERAAQALAAGQTVEPRLERRISKSTVVTRDSQWPPLSAAVANSIESKTPPHKSVRRIWMKARAFQRSTCAVLCGVSSR